VARNRSEKNPMGCPVVPHVGGRRYGDMPKVYGFATDDHCFTVHEDGSGGIAVQIVRKDDPSASIPATVNGIAIRLLQDIPF
jgi:hypothetical protein